jgi:TonB family protein
VRRRDLAALLAGALAVAAVPAARAGAPERTVAASFDVLVGFPAEGAASSARTVVVPGFVIPLDSAGDEREAAAERSAALAKAVERLWATFRLDPARRLQASKLAVLEIGQSTVLSTPSGSGVEATATLAELDASTAVVRVVVRRASKVLADSAASVKRGSRAVVGGMDGAEAPYVFVVVDVPSARKDAGAAAQGEVVSPVIVSKVAPVYPLEAKREGVQGSVVLEVEIDTEGRVGSARVVQGADPRLDQAALDAVRQWTYQPARDARGKAVKVLFTVTVRFALQ